jgi:type IV pilus biogenesis protein PilP
MPKPSIEDVLARAGTLHTSATDDLSPDAATTVLGDLLDEISDPSARNGGDITIEELDRLNREARRAESSLTLEKARLDKVKLRLEMLRLIQEASDADKAPSSAPAASSEAPRATPSPTEEKQARQQLALQREQKGLPTVAQILGLGGQFEAGLAMPDGAVLIAIPGMSIPHGFTVSSISASSVVLTGDVTGNRYVIAPGGSPQFRGDQQAEREAPRKAIDLGGIPIGVY